MGLWGCLLFVWGVVTDWLVYLLRGRLCLERQLEADGGQASYCLQPDRKQSPPTPRRSGSDLDSRTRRRWTNAKNYIFLQQEEQDWSARYCTCLVRLILKPGAETYNMNFNHTEIWNPNELMTIILVKTKCYKMLITITHIFFLKSCCDAIDAP